MALLGHAASAEDGSGYGIKGDQTGREVRLETLGADGNAWMYIYRYPTPSIAYNIGEAMRQCCINDYIGYSRGTSSIFGANATRYGLWNELQKTGDIMKIKEPVNCDCSSTVISCALIAGVPNAIQYKEMYTANEDEVLTKLGFDKYAYALPVVKKGDILWREGHTGIVVEADGGTAPSKTPIFVGEATKLVNVRTTPEIKNDRAGNPLNPLYNWPRLGVGNLVDVCDSSYAPGWYYVRIAGKYFGWVKSEYLVPARPRIPEVGDKVRFIGLKIYASSYKNGKGVQVPNFDAKVTQKNDQAHPYLIKAVDKTGYEGWANTGDLKIL